MSEFGIVRWGFGSLMAVGLGSGPGAVGSPEARLANQGSCPSGYTYRGTRETSEEIIVDCELVTDPSLPPCDQVPETLKAMEAEAKGLRRELQGNSREAARLAEVLDDWARLHQKARKDAQDEALELGWKLAVDQAAKRLQATARLHHDLNVQEAGLLRREWGALVARLSRMTPAEKTYHLNRIANARTAEQGLSALRVGLKGIDAAYKTGRAVIEPTREERLKAMAATLELVEKLFYGNPYTSLLITDLKSANNAAYGWWAALAARNRLTSFITLEDSLLKETIRESSRYVALTKAISAARRGEGYCRPSVG